MPNTISLCPTNTEALWWLFRHWSKAKVLQLELGQLPIGEPAYAGEMEHYGEVYDPSKEEDEMENLDVEQLLRRAAALGELQVRLTVRRYNCRLCFVLPCNETVALKTS